MSRDDETLAVELKAARYQNRLLLETLRRATAEREEAARTLSERESQLAAAEARLGAIEASRPWRWVRAVRRLLGRDW